MRCPEVGILRAYLDGELPADRRTELAGHVAACAACAAALDNLREVAQFAEARLAVPPVAFAGPIPAFHKPERFAGGPRVLPVTWLDHLTTMRARGAIAGVAAALLVVLLAISPVRLAAQDFLTIFRVQTFAAVTIDPSQLPFDWRQLDHLPSSAVVAPSGKVAPPEVKEVTAAEAAAALDFPLRRAKYLPASVSGQQRNLLSGSAEFSFSVDRNVASNVLQSAGIKDFPLPAGLDGATLTANVPPVFVTLYGAPPSGPFLVYVQTRGPTLEVPDSVDVDALRQAVLALPNLPADLVRQLRAIKDWRHTLVVPVPPGTHEDITVQGVPGLLISDPDQGTAVLWQKDGIVYGLYGNSSRDELLRVANSIS